ncbi:MAG: tetratricopeptide repeat protein [Leptothrix sp. (in: b-proteobacteria)]
MTAFKPLPPRMERHAPRSARSTSQARWRVGLTALLLSGALHAADLPSAAPDVQAELALARREIAAQNWPAAIKELERAVRKDRKQAEAHTLLGFAYRKSGQVDRAFDEYKAALLWDPSSVGAHEYVGEAYLMVKQPEKAREHLARLKTLCGEGCEQYQDLAKAIAAYKP